ncbi:MAG: hypothetical protein FJ297_00710 [Planctomycetes bacterium]|nr:hypothetical protein [Planctomycetota bacterium]
MSGTRWFRCASARSVRSIPGAWIAAAIALGAAPFANVAAFGQTTTSESPEIAADAAPGDAATGRGTIRFRRYLIPDRDKAELTRGLVPFRRDRFEEWAAPRQSSGSVWPMVVRARYFAVLDHDALRDGVALVDFQSGPSAAGGSDAGGNAESSDRAEPAAPVPLDADPAQIAAFDRLDLAIGAPVWRTMSEPARCGTDALGRFRILVPNSDQLIVPWTIRGAADGAGRIAFGFAGFPCPTSALFVAVPKSTRARTDRGVVSIGPWKEEPWSDLDSNAPFRAAVTRGAEVVRIDIEGDGACGLVMERLSADEGPPGIRVRQNQRFTMLPSRLELQEDLHFDCLGPPCDTFAITASAELRLIEARSGESVLDWSVEPVAGGWDRYTFRPPQPMTGADRIVRLVFHGDLVIDRPWQLPTVKVVESWWSEGRAELVFADSLVLRDIESRSAQCTRRGVAAPGVETLEFQALSADAGHELRIEGRSPAVRVDAGTAIHMDRDTVTARIAADLSATWGEAFHVRMRVTRPWSIDRVELDPPSALDTRAGSWRFENGILDIPLTQPVTVGRRLVLTVEGHRPAPPERTGLDGNQLKFWEFLDVEHVDELLRLESAAPHQVRLIRDRDVERIDPASLNADQRARLGDLTQGSVIRIQTPSSVMALVARDEPTFTSDAELDVTLDGQDCVETYRIRCVPESNPLRQLRVQLSRSRDVPLVWKVNDGDEPLAIRRITDSERAEGEAGDELWEVDLPDAMGGPFSITASRRWNSNGSIDVAFVSVPQALSQTGRLVLRSRFAVRWDATGLEAVPPDRASLTGSPPARGLFRYSPSHAPRLVIHRLPPVPAGGLWVWRNQLTTRVFSDGRAMHEATYFLENPGADPMVVRFADPVLVAGIWLDSEPVPFARGPVREARIPLAAAPRHVVVTLRYGTSIPPLGVRASIAAPWPELDAPVSIGRWTVVMPGDYGAMIQGSGLATRGEREPGLFARLFGDAVRLRSIPRDASDPREPLVDADPDGAHPHSPSVSGPWKVDSVPPWDALPETGWYSVEVEVAPNAADGGARVIVYHRHAWRAASWAAFFLVAAAAMVVRSARPSAGMVMAGAAAAIAWLVPASWTPMGAAVFLGVCAGLAAAAVRPVAGGARVVRRPSIRSAAASGAAGLIAVAALSSRGQESDATVPPQEPASVFRVLVPVDDQRDPVGEYVYVPPMLRDRIESPSVDSEPDAVWIRSAHYTARPLDTAGGGGDRIEIRAALTLETRGAGAIGLPFARSEARLLDAALDGTPAGARWSPSGTTLIVEPGSPGAHRLELTFGAPRPPRGADLVIAIPAAHLATATWESGDGAETGEFPERLGRLDPDSHASPSILGSTRRLAVRIGSTAPGVAEQAATGEQLNWLRIRPDSVVLDVRARIRSTERKLDVLECVVDPRLRLLPIGGAGPFDGEPEIVPGEATRIRWKLKPTSGNRIDVTIPFHWVDSTGVGRLDTPRVAFSGVRMTRSWLAVGAAPTLRLTAIGGAADAPRASIDAFMTLWGDDAEPPSFVVDVTFDEAKGPAIPDVRWDSRFRAVTSRWTDTTRVEARADSLRVTWDAVVDSTVGPTFLHHIRIPPDFRVESVLMMRDGEPQPLRFAAGRDGVLNVFVGASPEGRRQWTVQGEMPMPRTGEAEFPRIEWAEGVCDGSLVQVYRRPTAGIVTVEHGESWQSADVPPEDPLAIDSARPVGVWQVSPDSWRNTKAKLRVRRNAVRADAFVATRLVRDKSQSFAEIELLLRVSDGLFDTVRIELPVDWDGPFDLQPAHAFERRPRPGRNRQELVIRPPEPITGEFRWRIRAPWSLSSERMRRVPDVLPLDAQRTVRFLVLPTQWDTQRLIWSTSGAVARPLPRFFPMSESISDRWESYQILGSTFRVDLQRVERAAGSPRISLADHVIQPIGAARFLGVSRYDLEPGGTVACRVRLPHGGTLRRAMIDGLPIDSVSSPDGIATIPLGSPQWPQQLELLYEFGHDGLADDPMEGPRIGDFPVDQTLWTIVGRRPTGTERERRDEAPRAEQDVIRLESARRAVDAGLELATEAGLTTAADWLRLWASRTARIRADLRHRLERIDEPTSRAVARRLADVERAWRDDGRPPAAQAASIAFEGDPAGAEGLRAAWDQSRFSSDSLTAFGPSADGRSADGPSLKDAAIESNVTPWPRAFASLAALLAGVLAARLRWSYPSAARLREYPPTALAVAGVVCLVVLEPPLLGWFVLVAAAISAWLSPWRTEPARRTRRRTPGRA